MDNIFVIKHTAKDIEYTTDNFVEKNLDAIPPEINACILASKSPELVDIFSIFDTIDRIKAEMSGDPPPDEGKKVEKKTLGCNFREQINDLCG